MAYRKNKEIERAQLLGNIDNWSDDDDGGEDINPFDRRRCSSANEHESDEKMRRVKFSLDEVKGVMHSNIEKILERGDRLGDIEDKTDELMDNAARFSSRATKLKKQMCWQNAKWKLIIGGSIVLTIVIIILYYSFRHHGSNSGGNNPQPSPSIKPS